MFSNILLTSPNVVLAMLPGRRENYRPKASKK